MIPTPDRITELARQSFADLAQESAEFSREMRRLIPRLEVLPYQPLRPAVQLVPRAHVTLDLVPLNPSGQGPGQHPQTCSVTDLIVDLFNPPATGGFTASACLDLRARREKTKAEIAPGRSG